MKNTVFTGAATAIVTPLNKDGIDYEAFGRLIDWQIEAGIDAIVSVGTTGEGSTLDDIEHKEAMKFTVDRVAGRVPVIAGTGSNDIAYAISLTKYACEIGADEIIDNAIVKGFFQAADKMGNAQSVGHGAGVANVGGDIGGCVVGRRDILAVAKQAHGNAGDVKALLFQKKRGHGAVNAAAHSDHGGGGKGSYHKYLVVNFFGDCIAGRSHCACGVREPVGGVTGNLAKLNYSSHRCSCNSPSV